MPSILNARPNGLAPSGATVGDIVHTAGGSYQVMARERPEPAIINLVVFGLKS